MIPLTGSLAAQVHKTQRAPKEKLAAWATLEWTTLPRSHLAQLSYKSFVVETWAAGPLLPNQEIHLVVFLFPRSIMKKTP
jgi:hypothetical protein